MWNRFDRDAVLDHPTRQAILDLVREEPGIHFSRLLERVSTVSDHSSLGYGSLSHHLYRLERAGVVTSRRSGRHRRYYEARSQLGDPTALSVVQRDRTSEVARFVAESREVTQKQIAEHLSVERPPTRQVVAYHLRLLKNAGLVIVEPRGRRRIYVSTPRLAGLFSDRATPHMSAGSLAGRSPPSLGLRVEAPAPSFVASLEA